MLQLFICICNEAALQQITEIPFIHDVADARADGGALLGDSDDVDDLKARRCFNVFRWTLCIDTHHNSVRRRTHVLRNTQPNLPQMHSVRIRCRCELRTVEECR